MSKHKNTMIDLFYRLRTKYDLWHTFTDFIELSAIAISNRVDMDNYDRREQRYYDIKKQYASSDFNIFSELLAELVMWLEEEPCDALGTLFMELNLNNKWKGQFFTSDNVSRTSASMCMEGLEEPISKKGYISLCEPCCGSGSMVIGCAMEMLRRGYNYQKQLYVEATDIDIKATMMCYIQLSLLGVPAIVNCHNTLSCDIVSSKNRWITPMYACNHGLFSINECEEKVS